MSTPSFKPARKRRTCSYDMVEVPAGCYELEDGSGPMYFCNERRLGLWAATFATHPNRKQPAEPVALDLMSPNRECRHFRNVLELAQWAAANLLEGGENSWIKKGRILPSQESS